MTTLTPIGIKITRAGNRLTLYETTCKTCGKAIQTTRNTPINCEACHSHIWVERRKIENAMRIEAEAKPPDGMTRQAPLSPGVYRLLYYHPLYQEGRDYDSTWINKDIRAGLISRDAFRKVR